MQKQARTAKYHQDNRLRRTSLRLVVQYSTRDTPRAGKQRRTTFAPLLPFLHISTYLNLFLLEFHFFSSIDSQ